MVDQTIKALASAIAQKESGGNYQARGGSGEFGAYQFMPDTWKTWAKQHLGDSNAEMTIENQNRVAYEQIKIWKGAGLSPAQIASKWNSGRENAYKEGLRGTNKFGIKYDVPKYTADVSDLYRKKVAELKFNEATNELLPVVKEKEGVQGLAGVGTGAQKGVISTLGGASSLIRKGLQTILPKSIEELLGLTDEGLAARSQQSIKEQTKPKGTAETVGFIGEQVGEFFLPGSTPLKLGKLAAGSVKGGKALKTFTKLGTVSALEGALGLGQTAVQTGEVGQEAKLSGGIGLLTPGVASLAGRALRPIVRGFGKYLSQSLGLTTGAQGKAVQEAFNDPRVVNFARQAGKDMASFQDDILTDANTALRSIIKKRGNDYVSQLKKIKRVQGELDSVLDASRKVARQSLQTFDIKVIPGTNEFGKKLNKLDFGDSVLVEGKEVVERALDDVLKWTDTTPLGLDALKKRLQSYSNQLTAPGKKEAKLVVESLKHPIKEGLTNNVPGYKKMTSAYEQASNLIDEITSSLSLGKKNKEAAVKKIMASLKENNEMRRELLETLSRATKGDDFVQRVAGAQLGQLAPRGLSSKVLQGGVGVLALTNPSSWPSLLVWAVLASPRAVAEIVNILGRVTNDMIKLNKYSPQIQRAIREVIIKYNK